MDSKFSYSSSEKNLNKVIKKQQNDLAELSSDKENSKKLKLRI